MHNMICVHEWLHYITDGGIYDFHILPIGRRTINSNHISYSTNVHRNIYAATHMTACKTESDRTHHYNVYPHPLLLLTLMLYHTIANIIHLQLLLRQHVLTM